MHTIDLERLAAMLQLTDTPEWRARSFDEQARYIAGALDTDQQVTATATLRVAVTFDPIAYASDEPDVAPVNAEEHVTARLAEVVRDAVAETWPGVGAGEVVVEEAAGVGADVVEGAAMALYRDSQRRHTSFSRAKWDGLNPGARDAWRHNARHTLRDAGAVVPDTD